MRLASRLRGQSEFWSLCSLHRRDGGRGGSRVSSVAEASDYWLSPVQDALSPSVALPWHDSPDGVLDTFESTPSDLQDQYAILQDYEADVSITILPEGSVATYFHPDVRHVSSCGSATIFWYVGTGGLLNCSSPSVLGTGRTRGLVNTAR